MTTSTYMKSDVSTVMKALQTRSKFADKGTVKYELPRTVSALSNLRRQLKPTWEEYRETESPDCPKADSDEVRKDL
jgi:hypothetical protein